MKKLSFLLIFSIFLISCEDEEPALSTNLEGHWKWTSSCSSLWGCNFPVEPSDGGVMIITNAVIEMQFNDSVTFLQTYQLKNTVNHGNSVWYEVEVSDGSIWDFFVYSDNTMAVGLLTTSNYKRIK